jgi:hypothetical protein
LPISYNRIHFKCRVTFGEGGLPDEDGRLSQQILEIGCRAQAFAVGFLVESLAGFSPVGSGLAEFPSIQDRHKIRTLKAGAFGRPVFLPEGENVGRDAN